MALTPLVCRAQGYFFGAWDNTEHAPPLFCCFANASKNLSPCNAQAVPAERFVAEMQRRPADALFFAASDRPGCLLHLQALFPKRVSAAARLVCWGGGCVFSLVWPVTLIWLSALFAECTRCRVHSLLSAHAAVHAQPPAPRCWRCRWRWNSCLTL